MSRLPLVGLALGLAACAGPEAIGGSIPQPPAGDPGPGNPPAATVIQLTRFRPDSQPYSPVSGFVQAERLVITDQAAWQSVWQIAHATVSPEPPLPAVDFDREAVLAVAMGRQPSGGFAIRLEAAHQDDQAVTVSVRSVAPGAGCLVPQVVTSPVDLVRMPRSPLPVRFVETSETLNCD